MAEVGFVSKSILRLGSGKFVGPSDMSAVRCSQLPLSFSLFLNCLPAGNLLGARRSFAAAAAVTEEDDDLVLIWTSTGRVLSEEAKFHVLLTQSRDCCNYVPAFQRADTNAVFRSNKLQIPPLSLLLVVASLFLLAS